MSRNYYIATTERDRKGFVNRLYNKDGREVEITKKEGLHHKIIIAWNKQIKELKFCPDINKIEKLVRL